MELKTIAHLGRFKDIVATLFRYGFDDIVERLEVPGKTFLKARIPRAHLEMSTWERVRRALEELGPTFIKFGQIMSLRPDLLPGPLLTELVRLQDEVAAVAFPEIKAAIEQSLGRPLPEVFALFEERPLAAASLAQVHRAVLREGEQVVAVKVRRPNIRQQVETDISIMEILARHLDKRLDTAGTYDLPGLVQEFKRSLRRELDFTHEARNLRIVLNNFAGNSEVRVPHVFEQYSSERLLTMELLVGRKLKDLPIGDLARRELLSRRGLAASIKQIFEDGFFHADPHPGNLLIMDNDVLGLVDWGIVGRLSQADRFELVDLISAIIDKDNEKTLDILLGLVSVPAVDIDERRLLRDIGEVMDTYHSVPVARLSMGHLLMDINSLLRLHRLRIPADFALMLKALVTAEGTARQLYPELNVVEEAEPFFRKLAKERWKPEAIWRRTRRTVFMLARLQRHLPKHFRRLIEKLTVGEITLHLQHENLERLRATLENTTNRLTFGVIIGAMIIGSSMIITTGVEPLLFGYPALGIIGYLLSAILGIWLVVNIIRSRKF